MRLHLGNIINHTEMMHTISVKNKSKLDPICDHVTEYMNKYSLNYIDSVPATGLPWFDRYGRVELLNGQGFPSCLRG